MASLAELHGSDQNGPNRPGAEGWNFFPEPSKQQQWPPGDISGETKEAADEGTFDSRSNLFPEQMLLLIPCFGVRREDAEGNWRGAAAFVCGGGVMPRVKKAKWNLLLNMQNPACLLNDNARHLVAGLLTALAALQRPVD